jgi:hypothetical protein
MTIDKIAELQSQLADAEKTYLKERGWRYTSDFPDSCWRWVKKFGDKVLALSRSDAFQLEEVVENMGIQDEYHEG